MASLRESVRTTVQSAAMSFLAGYVDTLGFVALFGLFTAHVTGNFVLIGSELAHPSHGVLIKFVAFPAFILSVAFTRMAGSVPYSTFNMRSTAAPVGVTRSMGGPAE